MRYFEITETDAAAQADAQRAQRDKLTAANTKIAQASQTYQASLRKANDSAAAAKKIGDTSTETG
jgi:phage-related tail protein